MQFGVSGIMPGAMQRKKGIHAAVPIAHPATAATVVFILNIKTPTGRTHIGAGATVNAGKGNLLPKWGLVKGVGFNFP